MTRRREAFLDFYFGKALLQPTEAARLAGFRHPRTAAVLLMRSLAEVVEARYVDWKASKQMSPDEVIEGIAEIARDPHHKDRLRAYELMARLTGQLSDRLLLTVDRKQVQAELDAEFERAALDSKSNRASQTTEAVVLADRGPTLVRR